MNNIFQKKTVGKKFLERNKDTTRVQKSDSCINGQKGKAKFFFFFFTVLKSHIYRKVAYLPHSRGLTTFNMDQLEKSFDITGKSALKLVQLPSLKVIRLKRAKI